MPLSLPHFSAKADCCTHDSEFAGCSEVFDWTEKARRIKPAGKERQRKLEPEGAAEIKTTAGSYV
jgi:hypothetical protein